MFFSAQRLIPALRGWTVLTSNRSIWMSLQKKCPGHNEHAECRGLSSYYPPKMITAVTKAIVGSWQAFEHYNVSITEDIERHLLNVHDHKMCEKGDIGGASGQSSTTCTQDRCIC